MLDIRYIKECPDEVIARLAMKGKDAKEEIEQILNLDAKISIFTYFFQKKALYLT